MGIACIPHGAGWPSTTSKQVSTTEVQDPGAEGEVIGLILPPSGEHWFAGPFPVRSCQGETTKTLFRFGINICLWVIQLQVGNQGHSKQVSSQNGGARRLDGGTSLRWTPKRHTK